MFQTIKDEAYAEITEKKSKFICHTYHVESVEEVNTILLELRKKYHDARHNCYAYKIIKGDISKSSDDGEPSGTAGMPILNILNGKNLSNILVVVTRYFGGVLLGTGGLVRAYSLATTQALDSAEMINQDLGMECILEIDYKDLSEFKYQMKSRGISITNILYGEKIQITVEGKQEEIRKIMDKKIFDRIVIDNIIIAKEKYIYIEH